MPACLDGVQHRLDDGRGGGPDALLSDPGELDGFPSVAEVDGLAAHGEEHVRAVGPVPGGLGEAQRLDEVALGEAVGGDVVRGPAGEPGEVGGRGEEAAADGLAVRPAEHRFGLVFEVADEGLAGVAAAVGVVERAEEFADRAESGDVAAGDPLAGPPVRAALPGHGEAALGRHAGVVREARVVREPGLGGGGDGGGRAGAGRQVPACHPVVGAPDEPVPAGDDQARRGEGDLAEFGVAAGVLAPESADDVDGLLGGRGELQTRVDRRAGVETEVLGGETASEAAGEDLGDEGRRGAARLLAAEPAGHGGLVVPQIETVLQTELVDPSRQARMGESRFGDERGELAVRDALRWSFRHQLCGLLPSGSGRQSRRTLMERREFSGPHGLYRHLRPTFIRSCED